MTLKELMEKETPLNEGLRILRNSKRIRKLVKKIEGKMEGIHHPDTTAFLNDLRDIANNFEKIELETKSGNIKKAKREYKILKRKHSDVVRKINEESFKKMLKTAGVLGVLTLIGILTKIFIDFGNEQDEFGSTRFDRALKTEDKLFDEFISRTAKENNVSDKLVKALIQKESQGKEHVTGYNSNGTKDIGLMQLNSAYLKWMKDKFWPELKTFDPYDEHQNVELGTRYLSYLTDKYKGNIDKILAAYNAGPTAVDTKQIPKSTLAYVEEIKKNFKLGA